MSNEKIKGLLKQIVDETSDPKEVMTAAMGTAKENAQAILDLLVRREKANEDGTAAPNGKMKVITEYTVLSGDDPTELSALVTDALENGWRVYDGMTFANKMYHQVVIKLGNVDDLS